MASINKAALRAAMLIYEQTAGRDCRAAPVHVPDYAWNRAQCIRRQIDLARQHGWHGAATRLVQDLASALGDCCRDLEGAIRSLKSRPIGHKVSSASAIYRDIVALYDEFEDVNIDLDEHTLSVTTDRIVLEGIDLGRFRIDLDWHCLGNRQPYYVVALDPHPAAKRDDVTHPHVQDARLCEGEGRAAIRAALADGRLGDFFLVVSQLLHTYGRGSAYVELDHWHAVPCDDCGDSLDEDSRYYCDHCGNTLCGDCSISCQGCDQGFCSGCLSHCAACDDRFCSSCLENCSVCHRRFCSECLEAGLCQSCYDKQHHKDQEDDPSESARNEPVAVPV